jgi:hypothetical protein
LSRRRCLWLAVGLVLAALTAGVLLDLGVFATGLESRAGRVRHGMALAEVEGVVGRSADIVAPLDEQGGAMAVWYSRDGNLVVGLDAERRVARVRFVRLPER